MSLEASPATTRVGWIGTGVMGASMCGHLIAAGYRGDGLQPHAGRRPSRWSTKGADGRRLARRRSPRPRTWSSPSSASRSDVREVILGPDGRPGRRASRAPSWST